MVNIYNTAEDLGRHRMLSGGFIQYKNEWCYVNDIIDYTLYLSRIKDHKNYQAHIKKDIDDINLARPHLGFFNLGLKAYFSAVQPAKQMQQALRTDQIILYDINLNRYPDVDITKEPHRNLLHAFEGVYPSFQEAFESVKGAYNSRAFSRTLAIVKKPNKKKEDTFLLFHTTTPVGHWNPKEKTFIIDDTFKTSLIESILKKYEVPFQ